MNLKESELAIENISTSSELCRLEEAVSIIVESGGVDKVKRIIYDKRFRPPNLENQYFLLRFMSGLSGLPENHKLNALIASGHKAMESMKETLVNEAIDGIESALAARRVESLPYSDGIREDKTHITFSMYSVLWHLYIWSENIDGFLSAADRSFDQLPEPEVLTNGYYQTSTNVARCLAAYQVSCFVQYRYDVDGHDFPGLISKFLYYGILKSDDHFVKFSEYLDCTRIYHASRAADRQIKISVMNEACLKKLEVLLVLAMRGHVKEKVDRMKASVRVMLQKCA